MITDWMRLFAICAIFVAVQAQPTGLNDPSKKDEETTKPTVVKRSQEMLMFGNQQTRHNSEHNNVAIDDKKLSADKRTLSNSGLDDVASSRAENELDTQQKKESQQQAQQQQQILQQQLQQQEQLGATQPKALPSTLLLDQLVRSNTPQHAKNYDQLSYYQDPRYKRELDIDPDELIAFLSLYDNDQRNRGNWRYGNDEYDVDDDSALLGMSGDDPRGNNWQDAQLGYPLQQVIRNRYEPLSASELARSRYYTDKYMPNGLDAQQQHYNNDAAALPEYGTPQYGVAYGAVSPHRNAYYQPEKRFMVARKRSQDYDNYGNARNGLMYNSYNYPSYQHRLLY